MSSRTAEAPLRLLHLEDSELDHVLMLLHLQRGGLRVESQRVDSEADFLLALEQPWDVIVSDYNLPGFSGLVALDLLMARGTEVPFILVSGEIGEDTAVEAMRNGASDYLLKNNLNRLAPALLQTGLTLEPIIEKWSRSKYAEKTYRQEKRHHKAKHHD